MPFYEYRAIDPNKSCEKCIDIFEVMQSITSDPITECPNCNNLVGKILSLISGVVIAGREANQYKDIHAAKYWRDKNGVRHKVTPSDGYTTSGTVSHQTATPAEIEAQKKKDKKADKKKRLQLTTDRAKAWNKEQFKKV